MSRKIGEVPLSLPVEGMSFNLAGFSDTAKRALIRQKIRIAPVTPISGVQIISTYSERFRHINPQIASLLIGVPDVGEVGYNPEAYALKRYNYHDQTRESFDLFAKEIVDAHGVALGIDARTVPASVWIQLDAAHQQRTGKPLLQGKYVECSDEASSGRMVVVGRFREAKELEIDLWPKSDGYPLVASGIVFTPRASR